MDARRLGLVPRLGGSAIYHRPMRVIINGEETELPDGLTVRRLVERLGLADKPCAAEVNKSLVPKSRHETTTLRDGDRIELVTLVGGG